MTPSSVIVASLVPLAFAAYFPDFVIVSGLLWAVLLQGCTRDEAREAREIARTLLGDVRGFGYVFVWADTLPADMRAAVYDGAMAVVEVKPRGIA